MRAEPKEARDDAGCQGRNGERDHAAFECVERDQRRRAAQQRSGTPQRIPVGGNVQMARLIRQPRPDYPAELKQLGVTGVVMIQAVISKDGELLNPRVVNTDVDWRLAQSALDAVKQWRYTPTLLNGQPVEVATSVAVAYELDQ